MAMYWALGLGNLTPSIAEAKIIEISDWEEARYRSFHDTSAADTISRIINGYYNYQKVRLERDVTTQDIVEELEKGHLVILPVDGQALGNPYFNQPGPERHMLVVTGYDYKKKEFITNDPGTRHGEDYRYSDNVLYSAMGDYVSGYHEPFPAQRPKNMICL